MKKSLFISWGLIVVVILCSVLSAVFLVAANDSVEESTIIGDVDGDGVVSIMDATSIQMHLANLIEMTDEMLARAKVLGNDTVSILDATAIQRYLAELEHNSLLGRPVESPTEKPTDTPAGTEMHTIVFKDYAGNVLSSQSVPDGGTAQLPDAPVKSGQTFLGWAGNYANISKNETVKATYSDDKNVFIVESTSVALGETATVLVSIDGAVKTCGFELTLLYDSGLELVSYDADLDLDIVANEKAVENGIIMNFSSASDKQKQRDIVELTFRIKDAAKIDFPVSIKVKTVKEVSGSNIVNTDYSVINGLVKRR